ncbi:MAG: RNA-binding S4 domain-containing protein [Chlorobi bacterium]|nr:RNA-binding S4 domain-containing protein [Chlorobiota bacterium]
MRIDKYLWAVRIYKTRAQAAEACKKHHVRINGVQAKPSKEVFPGDEIEVRKNQINYRLRVLDLPPNRVGAKWVPLYMKDLTPPEAFEHIKLMQEARLYYRKKGTGRPTKKDRRALDDFLNPDDEAE